MEGAFLYMFYKTHALKNFAKFTGKHLFWSFFLIKLKAGDLPLYGKRPRYRCVPGNFAKFLRTPFS